MAQVTVSEGLEILKLVDSRLQELRALRNENANRERHFIGDGAKEIVRDPVYSVKALDKTISGLAATRRKLSTLIKAQNARTTVDGFDWDDAILGTIETAEKS
ncbi:MAG: hypothetical protein ACRER2_02605 [Methylococcales bacterium]